MTYFNDMVRLGGQYAALGGYDELDDDECVCGAALVFRDNVIDRCRLPFGHAGPHEEAES